MPHGHHPLVQTRSLSVTTNKVALVFASLLLGTIFLFSRKTIRPYNINGNNKIRTSDITPRYYRTSWTSTSGLKEDIPLNPQSSLYPDLLYIQHWPQEQAVVVTLKPNARCPRPYLKGRLSGPALFMLEWEWEQQELTKRDSTANSATRMIGRYDHIVIPPEQQTQQQHELYHLEIVALYCDDFFYDLLHDTTTKDRFALSMSSASMAMYNFRRDCAENPFFHRLNQPYSFHLLASNTTEYNTNNNARQIPGYWKRKSTISNNNNTTEMVYTRFQPYNCLLYLINYMNEPSTCKQTSGLERFEPYEFEWLDPTMKEVLSLEQLNTKLQERDKTTTTNAKKDVICLAGDSHSRVMDEAASRLGFHNPNSRVQMAFQDLPWPRGPFEFTPHLAQRFIDIYNCTKFVIALGQWPASYVDNRPQRVGEFHQHMKAMFQSLMPVIISTQNNNNSGSVQVYTRSIHYNPMSYMISSCPPRDWRNPVVMDAYNAAIEQVSREFNVPYLDTQFLTGPVWDSAWDFCHLNPSTAEAEVLYVAAATTL